MSMWSKLSTDIIQHIYEFDSTYKEKFDESLNFIEHAFPTCCCDGGKKERYRHHYDIAQFGFTFWDWEWRRRNACPKHNPGDFDKNGNQTEYNWRDMEYFIPSYELIPTFTYNVPDMEVINPFQNIVLHYEVRTGRNWYRYHGTINYNTIMLSLWMFATRKKNEKIPIKTYSRKKLCGARFMDMGHDQRPIAA